MRGERFLFTPQQDRNFTFKPILDGIAYDAEIKWQAGRWWLYIENYCSVPVVVSPDDHDFQLVNHTATNFIYRKSCQSFEVGFPKKRRWIGLIKLPVILVLQDVYGAVNSYEDSEFAENTIIDLGI